ncbi:hypothetical protein [Paenibacillus periandrae]|nr:hypothetical protein [Paenibacillus periandrae]
MGNLMGWCAEIEDAETVHQAGYAFIECSVLADFYHMDEEKEPLDTRV